MKTNKMPLLILIIMSITIIFTALVSADYTLGDTAAPEINVSISKTDPAFAEAGDIIDIWVLFVNRGEALNNMKITFIDNYPISLASESERIKEIPVLGNYYQLKYTIKIDKSAPVGLNYIKLKYTLGDAYSIEMIKEIPITVKKSQSILAIEDVTIEPEIINPGQNAKVKVTLRNIASSSSLKNIDSSLGLVTTTVGTEILDLPFTPVGSSSTKSISELLPNERAEISFTLASYPTAESKLYKIPLFVKYYDNKGLNYSKTELIGIPIYAQPEMLMTLESTDINQKKADGIVTFNIINKGLNDIKLATITLLPSEDYEISSPSNTLYIGNIDSDDFETADFNIHSKSNQNVDLKVRIEYRDAFNKLVQEEETFNYAIPAAPSNGSGSLWFFIILILVIIIIIYFVLKRRKKRE